MANEIEIEILKKLKSLMDDYNFTLSGSICSVQLIIWGENNSQKYVCSDISTPEAI